MKLLFKVFLLNLIIFGCDFNDQSQVQLRFKIKDEAGRSIDKAIIKIDGQQVGVTNSKGVFVYDGAHAKENLVKVELIKDSESAYYAPYFQNYFIGSDDQHIIDVDATLYSVPKSKFEQEVVEEDLQPKFDEISDKKVTDQVASIEKIEEKPPEAVKPAIENIEVSAAKPALNPVYEDSEPGSTGELASELPQKREPIIFTFLVFSGEKPVESASVFQKNKADKMLLVCKTNQRGRCVGRYSQRDTGLKSFVAVKNGFKSQEVSLKLSNQGKHRFNLKSGYSIDLTAFQRGFNQSKPLSDVEVWIDEAFVGKTSKFGFLSYPYSGKRNDLVHIKMKASGHLPETYETDFVVGGELQLERYFTPLKPPKIKIAALPVQPAGKVGETELAAFGNDIDKNIYKSLKKRLFNKTAFESYSSDIAINKLIKSNYSFQDVSERGWVDTAIDGEVDGLLIPVLEIGSTPKLFFNIIGRKGKTLVSVKEELTDYVDETAVDLAIQRLIPKLTEIFPFEGAVLSKSNDAVQINLGEISKRGIKVGNKVDIYATQIGEYGQSQKLVIIENAEVIEVKSRTSTVSLAGKMKPRMVISRGDLVVFRPQAVRQKRVAKAEVSPQSTVVSVIETNAANQSIPIKLANIYMSDTWLGSTDIDGNLTVDQSELKNGQILKVVKHGYLSGETRLATVDKAIIVRLKRNSTYLNIESDPFGLKVSVDGKYLGKTPIKTPILVPGGFANIKIDAPAGYVDFEKVFEVTGSSIDLTGDRKIILQKDLLSLAKALVDKKDFEGAVKLLTKVERSHQDFLKAHHIAGEILLLNLNRPVDAAKAFSVVTSDEAVKSFIDKRFIGTHINEGVALFKAAEKFVQKNDEMAIPHLIKAVNVFENVKPYLRHIPKEDYAEAVHNVDYHIALARHVAWQMTKDPQMLEATLESWQDYLQGSALSMPAGTKTKTYATNAKIYYKQALATKQSGSL